MDQRAQFVLEALEGSFTMSELCYRYGVSRKKGYTWVERNHRGGRPGCEDKPRAPRTHPSGTHVPRLLCYPFPRLFRHEA